MSGYSLLPTRSTSHLFAQQVQQAVLLLLLLTNLCPPHRWNPQAGARLVSLPARLVTLLEMI